MRAMTPPGRAVDTPLAHLHIVRVAEALVLRYPCMSRDQRKVVRRSLLRSINSACEPGPMCNWAALTVRKLLS